MDVQELEESSVLDAPVGWEGTGFFFTADGAEDKASKGDTKSNRDFLGEGFSSC